MVKTMTALKSKKSKPKTQPKVYRHTEDMEVAATKEYVRRELAPLKTDVEVLKRDVNRLWQVMLVGFGLILLVVFAGFQWLRSDMKELRSDMKELKKDIKTDMRELKTDMRELKTDMREINKRLDILIQNKQASSTRGSIR